LSLQPGTTVDGHVRGGKINEVFYLVDGLPVQDVFSGNVGTSLPKGSISNMTIYTGGFSAQYGNAMSGIVNIVTRGGDNTHQLLARFESGNKVPAILSTQSDNWKEIEVAANGPITKDKLFYYTANTMTSDNTRWWEDFQHFFSSPISQEFSGLSKVDYIINPSTRLSGQLIYSARTWRDYEYSWRYTLGGLPDRERDSYRVAALLSRTLSDQSFYTLSLNNFYVRNRIGENYDPDTLYAYQYDLFYRYVISGSKFWHADHRQNILTFKGDFSSLYEGIHTLSAGLELNQYIISSTQDRFDPQFTYFGKPIDDKPLLAYHDNYRYLPRSGGVYVQDKVEFLKNGSTIDLGVRWDFLDPAVSKPIIKYVKGANNSYTETVTGTKKASFKNQFSPRAAVSMPISVTSMFYVNYGIYYQYPLFDYLYSGISPSQIRAGTVSVFAGNPDLEPEKTYSWEIGYKQTFNKFLILSGAYFQKAVKNQLDTKTLVPSDSKVAGDYGFASYVNSAEADISGLEVMLSREGDERVSGNISYTYMISDGTSDYVNQAINYAQWGFPLYPQPYPLSWDQRHTFKADVSALLIWDVRANATLTYNTGRPYTYYPTRDGFTPSDTTLEFVPNNARMNSTFFVNAKFTKKIVANPESHLNVSVYVDMRNVFNAKNVQWIDSNGQVGGELNDPSAYYDPRRVRVGLNVEF
jgi:outer membrane receptor protein involved in Fe transport